MTDHSNENEIENKLEPQSFEAVAPTASISTLLTTTILTTDTHVDYSQVDYGQAVCIESPLVTEPTATESAGESVAVEFSQAEEVADADVEPASVEPVDVEPENVDPGSAEPENVEPASTDIASLEPVTTEQTIAEPKVTTEPETIEPVATEEPKAVVESIVEEPNCTEPAPVEVAAVEVRDAAEATQSTSQETPAEEPVGIQFSDLGLAGAVLAATKRMGYEKPSPIQEEMIPHMLEGRDVIGQAQTGTGKTAAFALPCLSKVDLRNRKPQVLVLAPTRELANQVAESFENYGADLKGLRVAAVYGGQSIDLQCRQLNRGAQIVVGTPGRTIDMIKRGALCADGIQCLVLDEADEMLNMGFLNDVLWVLQQTPKERQVALFSATMPGPIRAIAQTHLNDPVEIKIAASHQESQLTDQKYLVLREFEKVEVLDRLLQIEEVDGVMIFARTRRGTTKLAERLEQSGYRVAALNGDMAQAQRERTVDRFKRRQLDVLVATDVAARGLDIDRVSHVINYDFPHDSEAYVHRIGRTGRAGRKGIAILFVARAERRKFKYLQQDVKQEIEMMGMPTVEQAAAKRLKDFKTLIFKTIERKKHRKYGEFIEEMQAESEHSLADIAGALAHLSKRSTRDVVAPEGAVEQSSRSGGDRDRYERGDRRDSGGARRERPENSRSRSARSDVAMNQYRVEVGDQHGVRKGNLVGAIANEAGISSDLIGRIEIFNDHSVIGLPRDMPQETLQVLRHVSVMGQKLYLSELGGRGQDSGHRPSGKPQGRTTHGHGKRSEGGYQGRKPAKKMRGDEGKGAYASKREFGKRSTTAQPAGDSPAEKAKLFRDKKRAKKRARQ